MWRAAASVLGALSLCDGDGTYCCREQNLDNLKAAVLKADWFDPQINPKLAAFFRHNGMHVTPCRPYTPEHICHLSFDSDGVAV
jgi:hypothetical protein